MRTLAQRFWEKVRIGGPDECWPWTAFCGHHGYGRIGLGKTRVGTASRVSWELHHGPTPNGMHVLHRCDNPPCVNPAHLFLGSPRDNVLDMYAKGRGNRPRGEKHCCARFTPEQVISVRDEYARGGVSMRALAARHGVSHKAIERIISRVTWAHV